MKCDKEILTNLLNSFNDELVKAGQTGSVTRTLENIYDSLLNNVLKQARELNQNVIVQKAERSRQVVKNTRTNSTIAVSEEILRAQSLVFLVSAFETFLTGIFCHLVEFNYSEVILREKFPESLKIDRSKLEEIGKENISKLLGKILIENSNKDINFQDLQSTLRSFSNLLGIDLKEVITEDEKDLIIRFQAARHVIIHANSLIDAKYIKQVSETKFSTEYDLGQTIKVNEKMFEDTISTLTALSNNLISYIIKLC